MCKDFRVSWQKMAQIVSNTCTWTCEKKKMMLMFLMMRMIKCLTTEFVYPHLNLWRGLRWDLYCLARFPCKTRKPEKKPRVVFSKVSILKDKAYNMKQFLSTRFSSSLIQSELQSRSVSLLSCQAEFIPRLDPKCSWFMKDPLTCPLSKKMTCLHLVIDNRQSDEIQLKSPFYRLLMDG